jgi:hypothetical protein
MRQPASDVELRECPQEKSKNRSRQESILEREALASCDEFLQIEEGRAELGEIERKMRCDQQIEKRGEDGKKQGRSPSHEQRREHPRSHGEAA